MIESRARDLTRTQLEIQKDKMLNSRGCGGYSAQIQTSPNFDPNLAFKAPAKGHVIVRVISATKSALFLIKMAMQHPLFG